MESENNVICLELRRRLCGLLSGSLQALSPVRYIALGTGGQDEAGNPLIPSETQASLHNEVGRYPVAEPADPDETTARFSIVVPEGELAGMGLNEMALVSGDGALYMLRNTLPKFKEEDEEFEFVFDCKL